MQVWTCSFACSSWAKDHVQTCHVAHDGNSQACCTRSVSLVVALASACVLFNHFLSNTSEHKILHDPMKLTVLSISDFLYFVLVGSSFSLPAISPLCSCFFNCDPVACMPCQAAFFPSKLRSFSK